jgi:hypothetical protein
MFKRKNSLKKIYIRSIFEKVLFKGILKRLLGVCCQRGLWDSDQLLSVFFLTTR